MISLEKVQQSELAQIHFLQKVAFESLYDTYQDEGSPFKETQASLLAKFKRLLECYFLLSSRKKESVIFELSRMIRELQRNRADWSGSISRRTRDWHTSDATSGANISRSEGVALKYDFTRNKIMSFL